MTLNYCLLIQTDIAKCVLDVSWDMSYDASYVDNVVVIIAARKSGRLRKVTTIFQLDDERSKLYLKTKGTFDNCWASTHWLHWAQSRNNWAADIIRTGETQHSCEQ